MNTPNNKRKKESREKIEKIFVQLIQAKEINEISITDICKKCHLNRSTFYASYIDIYDLADKIRERLEIEIDTIYKEERETNHNSNNFLKLFKNIKENQIFYCTYFKLNMDKTFKVEHFQYDYNLSKIIYNDKHVDYHIEFFMAGLNAIIKKWLNNGCKESPEEINQIIIDEYKNQIF